MKLLLNIVTSVQNLSNYDKILKARNTYFVSNLKFPILEVLIDKYKAQKLYKIPQGRYLETTNNDWINLK